MLVYSTRMCMYRSLQSVQNSAACTFKEQTTVWDYLTTATKTKSTSTITTTTAIQLILVIYCHVLACQLQRNSQFQIQHYDT